MTTDGELQKSQAATGGGVGGHPKVEVILSLEELEAYLTKLEVALESSVLTATDFEEGARRGAQLFEKVQQFMTEIERFLENGGELDKVRSIGDRLDRLVRQLVKAIMLPGQVVSEEKIGSFLSNRWEANNGQS